MTNQSELVKLQNGNTTHQVLIVKGLDKTKPPKPLGERKKAVLRQELMVLLGNTCVVASGMSVALPSVSLAQLTDPNDIYNLNTEESSWFASINSMACPLGGLLVGYLMDRIGRRNTMLCTNCVGIVGLLLLVTAPSHSTRDAIYIQLLVGRFLCGLMIGLSLSPIGSYSAEISLPRIRGRLIMGTSIAIACGILFMYLLGYFIRNNFKLISIISVVYQCFAFCCCLPMPESPSWLLQKGYEERARKSLKYFRGLSKNDNNIYEEFETELALIKKNSDLSRSAAANESLLQAIRAPEVYKPLIMMIGLFFFQQCSGIVVVIVFAAQIATRAGVSADPLLVAVFVGVARIVTTFFMGAIFEKWGRRPAGIVSAAGMTVCMLILAANGWWPAIGQHVPLLPVVAIVLHIIFSTMGLLTLPFFMISEVFPQRVRGSANGFTLCIGLLFSFSVVKLYPTMETLIGTANSFAFFGAISLLGVAFIYFIVPETKGRSLLEIENYFRTGRKVSNAEVARRQSQIAMEEAAGIYRSDLELNEVFLKLSKVDDELGKTVNGKE
ncbi:facilitated trehalose transporter Tret1-2 homolog [Ceratitis capitata]|uniref:facilitated trehalose transporter Tret1-2 homolog n=1 Tax=Ceratitis capitata TaxID=7213 RepID=UPI0003296C52|nr:facilitated trehalose transporter Tret1-2 homolog [Ceratitis capitata]XP_004520680.1 facilitated trehalose transporter Tret1-2 homolog [Ceratitis capitata]